MIWDNNNMKIDLSEMRCFLPDVVRLCNSFSGEQEKIVAAYAEIKTTWRDKICLRVGEELYTTGTAVEHMHNDLTELVYCVRDMCNSRADYAELDQIYLSPIQGIGISIKEDLTMQNEKIETTKESLIKFGNSLDNYIDSTIRNVNDLERKYREIGDSWKDAQYTAFGDEIGEFKQVMQRQIDEMDQILTYIRYKASKLER